MKKLSRFLALALLLSMTLCWIPASAKYGLPEYEWLYNAMDKKNEDCTAVQIGSWRSFNGAQTACELLRSYGYEAFIYYSGNYRVCVGLFPDYAGDHAPAQELIDDLKTLTRDSDYLTSCCAAYATTVRVPAEAKEKFTAFGGEAPEATEEPVRTDIVLRQPYKSTKLAAPVKQFVDNPSGKRIFMYYDTAADAGICGFLSHGEEVNVLARDGKCSFVEAANNKRQGWIPTAFLSNSDPLAEEEVKAEKTA